MKRFYIFLVSGILLVSTTTGGVKAEEILKFTCDLYWTNNIFMVSKTFELKSEDLDVKTKDYIEWTEFSSTPNKPGYDWGISFNNSRAYTAMLWNANKDQIYQWFKRYEGEWTWVTMVVDTGSNNMHFYLNGRESSARNGTGTSSPITFNSPLKHYGSEPYYIGRTPSVLGYEPNAFFKGKVSDIKFWNRALTASEINYLYSNEFNP